MAIIPPCRFAFYRFVLLIAFAAAALSAETAEAQVRGTRAGKAGQGKTRQGRPSGQSLQERYRIALPAQFDETNRLTPVVFALHGYKGHMEDMETIWQDVCEGMGVILVVLRGSKVVDGGYSWASAEDAGDVIEAARKELRSRYRLHLHAPRVLTGFSQGAFEAYALADAYTRTWRRLIPAAGMFRAKTTLMAQPFTTEETAAMKRWRVYMMVGMQDAQELVANQNKLALDLQDMGAAVEAPFREMDDPSWGIYQETKHSLPTDKKERDSELRRALRFVLTPDSDDERHWTKADPHWRKRARWLKDDPPPRDRTKAVAPRKPKKEKSGRPSASDERPRP